MVRAEGVTAPLPRHVAVEREAERVEQERLAGPGGTVDQKEPLRGEFVEVDLDLAWVGAQSAERETVWHHPPTSLSAEASASEITAACASDASAPCWSTQNSRASSSGFSALRTASTTAPPPGADAPIGSVLERHGVGKARLQTWHGLQRQLRVGELDADPSLLGVSEGAVSQQISEAAPQGPQRAADPQGHDFAAAAPPGIHLDDAHRLGVVLLGERIGQRRARVGHAAVVEHLVTMEVTQGDIVEPVEGGHVDEVDVADGEITFRVGGRAPSHESVRHHDGARRGAGGGVATDQRGCATRDLVVAETAGTLDVRGGVEPAEDRPRERRLEVRHRVDGDGRPAVAGVEHATAGRTRPTSPRTVTPACSRISSPTATRAAES